MCALTARDAHSALGGGSGGGFQFIGGNPNSIPQLMMYGTQSSPVISDVSTSQYNSEVSVVAMLFLRF
jgi:hypothetical protein